MTRKFELVIFDMDGTLIELAMDFDEMRREIGLPEARGILEQMAEMGPQERRRAEAILDRHEAAAAEACVLHEGAAEILAKLAEAGVRTALLTRNSTACTQSVLARHGLQLDWIATRNHKPYKPHADSILNITRRFGVPIERTLMVGDYKYDLQAAHAAGCDSVLMWAKSGDWPAYASMATYRMRRLEDLLQVVGLQERNAQ